VVKVPGAWELPVIVKALAEKGRYDAMIAIRKRRTSIMLRGNQRHCARVLETGVPVAMGVLTTNTVEQAIDAGAKSGNKGFDAR
jgi:6,7-dimethyl-8-ribityllumazine synthase